MGTPVAVTPALAVTLGDDLAILDGEENSVGGGTVVEEDVAFGRVERPTVVVLQLGALPAGTHVPVFGKDESGRAAETAFEAAVGLLDAATHGNHPGFHSRQCGTRGGRHPRGTSLHKQIGFVSSAWQ